MCPLLHLFLLHIFKDAERMDPSCSLDQHGRMVAGEAYIDGASVCLRGHLR
jgi:hypothetical protein